MLPWATGKGSILSMTTIYTVIDHLRHHFLPFLHRSLPRPFVVPVLIHILVVLAHVFMSNNVETVFVQRLM
jgi:hypothetical protein